jgi:hypothetical protein
VELYESHGLFWSSFCETKQSPHHTAGTHRRILLNGLLDYKEGRNRARLGAIERMSREAGEAGVYGQVLLPTS